MENEQKSWHTFLVDQATYPKSVMGDMTPSEREAFGKWFSEQKGEPESGGSVDGLNWPGWGAVVERRAKERFSK